MHRALSHVISSLKCSQQPSKGGTPIFILQMRAWRWSSQGPLSLCPHSSCVLPCPNLQHAQGSRASLSGQLFLPLLNLRVIPKSQRASPPRGPAGRGNSVCFRAKPSCFIPQTQSGSFLSKSQKMVWSADTLAGVLRISLEASLSFTTFSGSSSHHFYFFQLFQNLPCLHLHDYGSGSPPLSATYYTSQPISSSPSHTPLCPISLPCFSQQDFHKCVWLCYSLA